MLQRPQHLSRVGPAPLRSLHRVAAAAQHGGASPNTRARRSDDYERALDLAREERYDEAREAFEQLLERQPRMCKAWVSFAQMERRLGRTADPCRFEVARQILQRGLQLNPDSGCLAQAWGLMELQKGNWWAAVRLLERCVDLDPFLAPVLRWQPVRAATQHARMGGKRAVSSRAARTICGARPGAPAAAGGGTGSASSAPGGTGSGSACSSF